MSKISFNKNNFINYAKRGLSLALIPITVALSSCSTEEEIYEDTSLTTSITETTTEIPTTIIENTTETISKSEETTIEKEEEVTRNPYNKITPVVEDEDFPIYAGTDENGFNYLITEDKQRISNAYDYYVLDPETRTIKLFHKTSPNSDLKTWFDLYSYEGEQLLHNLSYTTFDIIPGTDLAVYKFEETDNYGILRMRTDHCERIIHSAFTNVATYQPKDSAEEKDQYILGINEEQEIFIYDTNLALVTTGKMSSDEAIKQMEDAHTSREESRKNHY